MDGFDLMFAALSGQDPALIPGGDDFEKLFASALYGRKKEKVVYGVRFDGGANSGDTVHRLYAAAGKVAGVGTDTETAVNDFDSIYPWSGMRRACGYWDNNGDFHVNAYKGEAGYTTDGSNGEVWVEIPKFYFAHFYDGDEEQIEISRFPFEGYLESPFNSSNGCLYMPAYMMSLVDNKPTSRAGTFPTQHSLNSAMTDARKAGGDFAVTTSAEWYTISLLMFVEFATRDMQAVMAGASSMPYAAGYTAAEAGTSTNDFVTTAAIAAKYTVGQTIGIGTSAGNASVASDRVITAISGSTITFDGSPVNIAVGNVIWTSAYKTGSCDGVLSTSGSPKSNVSGKYDCVYRGIESPYGNAYQTISDVLLKREGAGTAEDPYTYDVYHLPDVTKYSNGSLTADYVKLGYQIPSSDGYAQKLGMDNRYPLVRAPVSVGATSKTYCSDYYYYPRSALCAARVGGTWYNGSNDGPSYWSCDNAPSNSYVSFRARLSKPPASGGSGAAV